ncbi:MAG: sulfatase-like hydrolase/transferase [Planctomycetes bacterium]|nr:sulfatase-like hydrolase/transferase [Planctomycetota bacterium]
MFLKLPAGLRQGKKEKKPELLPKLQIRSKALKFPKPRIESGVLLIGLACTVFGKLIMILRQEPPHLFLELMQLTFPDIVFFAAVFVVIHGLYALKPSIWITRLALLSAILFAVWSVLDVGWLTKCGVQLQPAVLFMLVRDFKELWPLLWRNIRFSPKSIIVVIAVLSMAIYLSWKVYKPKKIIANRAYHTKCSFAIILVVSVLFLTRLFFPFETTLGFTGKALSFNSHWHALASVVVGLNRDGNLPEQTRNVATVGQRKVTLPNCSVEKLPNILMVLMESVSYETFSSGNTEKMPNLARIASQGAFFPQMRIITARSTKALWAMLTSTTPSMQSNYVESVYTDQPYEGLPSILARLGYKSAHFEMGRGSCEAAPAFYKNMTFDWAWFRENTEDPSIYLGHFAGDDVRVIEPAFKWASEQSEPFLLTLSTTVTHGPGEYNLPNGFAQAKETPHEKFLEAVRYTDYLIELIFQKLKEQNFDKNTIVCILGDHGGSFRAGADNERWAPYEEVIRVPWVIWYPGHVKPGQVYEWPCSQLDFTPTLLTLVGFGIDDAGFEGKDAFVPSDQNRKLYFSSWYFNSPIGFVEGDRKVVYWPYINKVFEYDLKADPKELNPKTLSSDQAGQVKQDVLQWKKKTYIDIDPRRSSERLVYSHWRTFSAGQNAWAYYVP